MDENHLCPLQICALQFYNFISQTLLSKATYKLLGGETYVLCSVVLPAPCDLHCIMEVSGEDTAHMGKFKTAFVKALSQRIATLNHEWLRIATVLDPCFKDLKCLGRGERKDVWTSLETLLQEQEQERCSRSHTGASKEEECPSLFSVFRL